MSWHQWRSHFESNTTRPMPVITAEDSLASVQFVETAYKSAGTNHWLRIEALG